MCINGFMAEVCVQSSVWSSTSSIAELDRLAAAA